MEHSVTDYLQQAREHEHLNRYTDAVQACDAALALDPTFAAAYLMRAQMRYFSCGKPYSSLPPSPTEADCALIVADLEQAYHFAANDVAILTECALWMGLIRGFGMMARSIEIYTTLLTLDPTNAYTTYMRRGWVHQTEQRPSEAIADFTEAIQLDPTQPDAYAARGHVYEALRQRNQAAADFRQALELGHTGFYTQFMRDYVGRYGRQNRE